MHLSILTGVAVRWVVALGVLALQFGSVARSKGGVEKSLARVRPDFRRRSIDVAKILSGSTGTSRLTGLVVSRDMGTDRTLNRVVSVFVARVSVLSPDDSPARGRSRRGRLNFPDVLVGDRSLKN